MHLKSYQILAVTEKRNERINEERKTSNRIFM